MTQTSEPARLEDEADPAARLRRRVVRQRAAEALTLAHCTTEIDSLRARLHQRGIVGTIPRLIEGYERRSAKATASIEMLDAELAWLDRVAP